MTKEQWENGEEVDQVEAKRDTEPAPPPGDEHDVVPVHRLVVPPICVICDGMNGQHDPACPYNPAVSTS